MSPDPSVEPETPELICRNLKIFPSGVFSSWAYVRVFNVIWFSIFWGHMWVKVTDSQSNSVSGTGFPLKCFTNIHQVFYKFYYSHLTWISFIIHI